MAFSCLICHCKDNAVLHKDGDHSGKEQRSRWFRKERFFRGYEKDISKELRIVLLGKTGSGKSSTGNTILGVDYFKASPQANAVTPKCNKKHAHIFGRDINIVDTPGLFDTSRSNDEVIQEIFTSIGLTEPGPHCFLLVLEIGRFTEEEEKSVNFLVKFFGNNVYRYFIIVFTHKDKLYHDKLTLEDFIKNAPESLKKTVIMSENRCIAFNNLAKGSERKQQVKSLLGMINDIISKNNGMYYSNEMYLEAEKLVKQEAKEIEKKRREKYEKEMAEIEQRVAKREREREIQRLKNEYSNLKHPRDEARENVAKDKKFVDMLVKALKNIGIFVVEVLLKAVGLI